METSPFEAAKIHYAQQHDYRRREVIGEASEQIVAAIPTQSRVLDIGCGDGSLLEALANRKQCTVQGIDISPGAIALATERGVNALKGDVDRFDLDERIAEALFTEFDFVIFRKSIQYALRRNEIIPKLNTGSILVYIGNPDHFRRHPLLRKDRGPDSLPGSTREFFAWMRNLGFAGEVLHYSSHRQLRRFGKNRLTAVFERYLSMNVLFKFTKVA